MSNSLIGDVLTNMGNFTTKSGSADVNADMDAYILTHYPGFASLSQAAAMAKYYSMANLNMETQKRCTFNQCQVRKEILEYF